jgi:hypothetical protein
MLTIYTSCIAVVYHVLIRLFNHAWIHECLGQYESGILLGWCLVFIYSCIHLFLSLFFMDLQPLKWDHHTVSKCWAPITSDIVSHLRRKKPQLNRYESPKIWKTNSCIAIWEIPCLHCKKKLVIVTTKLFSAQDFGGFIFKIHMAYMLI